MSRVSSEEPRRHPLVRAPHCTGRTISDRLRTVEDGPAPRLEERAGRLRREQGLAHGHAEAVIREYGPRRAARRLP